MPDYLEGPPSQEEFVVVEEKEEEKKGLGWNLPPAPPNWHDQPPKKGVSYTILENDPPIYVYVKKKSGRRRRSNHHHSVPFTTCSCLNNISNQGWDYVKYCKQPCAVFLDEKKSPDILAQLQAQKHPQLIAGTGTALDPNPPLTCFCYEPLAFRVIQTPKNSGRLFLACKTQQCRLF